ncbi:alpha/beta fold hydrolase [uncultured Parasphingorhabdus sp.]|uniref:alpha/beta fold hydrolase n=1 Tax=uncultured Parasphingorhabdus sp. TaxID=2709694 RepID=UPI0030D74B96|tara:strand:- start:56798 stop:57649 length:852 start_codon:yes stop_codon:yes gene_type:complete
MTNLKIDRAFVSLDEGQLHLRILEGDKNIVPIILLHASPASSWFMQGLIRALADAGFRGSIIAPDTLGNGDSVVPSQTEPDIGYFADSIRRMMDALGLKQAHIYGTHTGARIACEFGVLFPDSTGTAMLDGITEYADELREQIIANYAPKVEPDEYGRHLIWAFNFCRDQALYFPHFLKTPENRLAVPMPPPEILHRITLDVLKSLDSYSKPYLAAFNYRAFDRMPKLGAPTLLLKRDGELAQLNQSIEDALKLLPDGHAISVAASDADKASAILNFLERTKA